MTQQEITHYSELMARFEGAEIYTENIDERTFNYHTSYDCLHRVWVKFRDLKFDDSDNDFTHYNMCFSFLYPLGKQPIEVAFLELGRSIEWYNKIKK